MFAQHKHGLYLMMRIPHTHYTKQVMNSCRNGCTWVIYCFYSLFVKDFLHGILCSKGFEWAYLSLTVVQFEFVGSPIHCLAKAPASCVIRLLHLNSFTTSIIQKSLNRYGKNIYPLIPRLWLACCVANSLYVVNNKYHNSKTEKRTLFEQKDKFYTV